MNELIQLLIEEEDCAEIKKLNSIFLKLDVVIENNKSARELCISDDEINLCINMLQDAYSTGTQLMQSCDINFTNVKSDVQFGDYI